jgi:hypothetical protein
VSRFTDWFKGPAIIDINQTGDSDKPYQPSCPEGDFTGQPSRTIGGAVAQQAAHWTAEHYHFDDGDTDTDRGWFR